MREMVTEQSCKVLQRARETERRRRSEEEGQRRGQGRKRQEGDKVDREGIFSAYQEYESEPLLSCYQLGRDYWATVHSLGLGAALEMHGTAQRIMSRPCKPPRKDVIGDHQCRDRKMLRATQEGRKPEKYPGFLTHTLQSL